MGCGEILIALNRMNVKPNLVLLLTRFLRLLCQYVDLEYQGGGEGEYQIIDPQSKKWDSSNCIGDRCVKMDCHLPVRGHGFLELSCGERSLLLMLISTF